MEKLVIQNESFELIKNRTYSPTYQIFKGNNVFLRIGPVTEITQEISRHTELLALGFPIAKIIKQGSYEQRSYYIEESMGNTVLGMLFGQDYSAVQHISDKHFAEFLHIIKSYAKSQLQSRKASGNLDEFAKGFYLPMLYEERPDLKDLIDTVFSKVFEKIKELPFVLTHGDFNAHNIFPKGIIDLENFHYGPLGYDLASAIVHPYAYPPVNANTESSRTYLFTQAQEAEYLKTIDSLFKENNVNPLSKYLDEYTLCRFVFSCVDMHHRPLVQKWRYELLEKLMDKYLAGEPLSLSEIV